MSPGSAISLYRNIKIERVDVAPMKPRYTGLKTVVVTGATGFIGQCLCHELLACGYRVIGIDDSCDDGCSLKKTDCELIIGRVERGLVARACAGLADCVVVHLAATTSVLASVRDPIQSAKNNVMTTLRVLEDARKTGARKILLASSGGATVGNAAGGRAHEMSPTRPLSPYGASKACIEAYSLAYRSSYNLDSCCLRLSNVYGPHSRQKSNAVNTFLRCARKGEPLRVYGRDSARDFVYVEDVCSAIIRCIEADDHVLPGILNICTGVATAITELAQKCIDLTRSDSKLSVEPARVGEVRVVYGDPTLAHELIGLSMPTGLDEGLMATWSWMLDSGE